MTANARHRLIGRYAAKFMADTVRCEPPRPCEPTDANLATVLANCVRVPRLSEYAAVRSTVARMLREDDQR